MKSINLNRKLKNYKIKSEGLLGILKNLKKEKIGLDQFRRNKQNLGRRKLKTNLRLIHFKSNRKNLLRIRKS